MKRWLFLLYGIVVYSFFLAVFLYLIGFLGDFLVPKAINGGAEIDPLAAAALDIGLILLFGIQHSVMARRGFKRWWTRIIPTPLERSTYVLITSLLLVLLMWQWRPLPGTVWHVDQAASRILIWGLFWIGWGIVLLSTWLIHHFELFGLQQTFAYWRKRPAIPPAFKTPLLYRWVRHPLQLGLLLAFWATPHMTSGHMLFAAAMTLYILIGLAFEERDLMRSFGDAYRNYRRTTPMLLPGLQWVWPRPSSNQVPPQQPERHPIDHARRESRVTGLLDEHF